MSQFHDVDVSDVAILGWIRKYVRKIKKKTERLKIDSDKWHVDETAMYFGKHLNWVWNIMDADSRFLLDMHIGAFRNNNEGNRAFNVARYKTKDDPETIVTDGLNAYPKMIERFAPKSKHERYTSIRDVRLNNNPIERFHATLKSRTKIMNGFFSIRTARKSLDGWRIYYNFVKPHLGLNGLTPAEAAGLDIGLGRNKWEGLVQISSEIKGLS